MILVLLASFAVAAPMPTKTPSGQDWLEMSRAEIYSRGVVRGMEARADDLRKLGAWIVTATATATPWPTEQPTPTGDCCRDGHAWQPIKVGREHAGGRLELHYLEWMRRGVPYEPKEPRFYERTSLSVQRCRRCGLWKERT